MTVFWVVTPCNLVEVDRHFGGAEHVSSYFIAVNALVH
jgi:hypothetical protein